MAIKFKDAAPTLCLVTGFVALVSYVVMFSVAWGFYDQGYPNGLQIRNAALVSTVPLFFILALCLTCTLTVCCKDFWAQACPSGIYDRSRATFCLALLSPLLMVFTGIFATVGGTLFAILAATFVPQNDNTNLFEIHLFGATASVFGVLTGLCCCFGAMFCCCAVRGEDVQEQLVHLQEHRMKLNVRYVDTNL